MLKVLVIFFVFGNYVKSAFAEHGEQAVGIESLTIPAINFGVYLLLLIFVYKKYLRVHIQNSSKAIEKFMQRSAEQLAEAEQSAQAINKRKNRLEDEKIGIILKYKKEGEIQKDRILAKALQKSDKILAEVQTQIDKELAKAETEIEQEVFKIALAEASEKFKQMSEEQDKQLRGNVLEVLLNRSMNNMV
ncbi:MAG: ATP synthase F0 subunit B [Deltaproteobacteria bacterium]|jgi:F0F1-type ATP synthase membrane subunit b/b'|nr:ATP synthase F0 subunit B [Deltaproteobacteria bacterium]